MLIYFHYLNTLRLRHKSDTVSISALTDKERLYFILELLVSIIAMPPYFNATLSGSTLTGKINYPLSAIISAIIFFKLYHIQKIYSDFTV